MQIPAKKIKRILLVLLIASSGALAQDNNPGATATGAAQAVPNAVPGAPAAPGVPGAPAAPVNQSQVNATASATSTALDYLYNHKPQEGTAAEQASQANETAKNRTAAGDSIGALGDSQLKQKFEEYIGVKDVPAAEALGMGGKINDPELRARFEKYLGTKEVPAGDLAAYETEVQKIMQLLHANQTFAAWRELQVLGSYESIDAGVSYELANRIESIWNSDKASNHIANENAQLREQVRESNNNADLMSESIRKNEVSLEREENQGKNAGKNNNNGGGANNPGAQGTTMPGSAAVPNLPSTPNTKGIEGRLRLTEEYLGSLEGKARIKLNELKEEKLLEKTKTDFATYTKTLFDSGRQQDTILAAEFYLKIFDEDEYPVEMGNEVNASLEMAKDVSTSVDVFRYKVDKGEIASAAARLQEAFSAGENQPAVLGLERTEKEKVEEFSTHLDKIMNLIEARDFGPMVEEIEKTKKLASDFDGTKAMALVNAVKLESKMHLARAKLAAEQKDLKAAVDEFQEAAKEWPGNPELVDSSTEFFNSEDTKNQALTEFDRLIGENNFREIFDKQLLFATAVHGDTKREDLLKNALEKIKYAEIAAEKANVMRNAGDVFGAWETIELAAKDLPNDNKLNTLRADLAGKGAEFVAAINNAKDAETRGELGYSLTWYAVAQRYYPASVMANDAIDRLSKKLLGTEKTTSSL